MTARVMAARDPRGVLIARASAGANVPLIRLALAAPLVVAAFADMPQAITAGPVSGLGALTIGLGCLAVFGALACGAYPKRLLMRVLPYFGFLIWMGLSMLWAHPSFWGIQNAILYTLFGSLMVTGGVAAARGRADVERLIARCMRWIDWVALVAVGLNLILHGLPTHPGEWFVGPRSVALLALAPLSWHLAEWYYGSRRAIGVAAIWLAAVAASLSRTAMAIALVLLALTCLAQLRFRRRQAVWSVMALLVAAGIVGGLVAHNQAFSDRLFSGDQSIRIGGTTINAEGRLEIWSVVIASAKESPIIGKGVGSNQVVLGAAFEGDLEPGHPHNDYLRLWHDLGIVGLVLFVASVVGWIVSLLVRWYRSEKRRASARLELAAAMALIATLLAMLTDNVIVYVFVMGPVGVLVGAALGGDVQSREHE